MKAEQRNRSVTKAWRAAQCNACGLPIADIGEALAMWFVDRDRDGQTYGQTHTPAIVHRDCYRRVRSTSLSIRVELFRRSPMDAIVIAMQRRATSEAERIVWHAWLSVVLGLPFNQWNDIGWLRNGAAAHVPDRVPSLDEMRRDVGGAA